MVRKRRYRMLHAHIYIMDQSFFIIVYVEFQGESAIVVCFQIVAAVCTDALNSPSKRSQLLIWFIFAEYLMPCLLITSALPCFLFSMSNPA